ncbi:MAG: HD domain-containing protein [Deltaproteobacteria bacterium]|jgi:3'-5' exoribonuclease|nr:HD domain-containing protein [Deltaproteobacteria bacterium]
MKILKNLFARDLELGQEATIPLLVESCVLGQTRQNFPYLNLSLKDNTGSIVGKVWDNAASARQTLVEGRVAVFHGVVGDYRGERQLKIDKIVPVSKGDYDEADYKTQSPVDPEVLKRELLSLAGSVKDPDFREITLKVLTSPETQGFWTATAAKRLHHAYEGGLAEHSLNVAKLCLAAAQLYPEGSINVSLLLSGAILHDIGKIWEFNAEGEPGVYTTTGKLLGHPCLGAFFVGQAARSIPAFPELKRVLLEHILLSHHGDPSMGAAKEPKIVEAVMIHQMDMLDARVNGFRLFIESERAKAAGQQGLDKGWTSYNRAYGTDIFDTPTFAEGPPEPLAVAPAARESAKPQASAPEEPITEEPIDEAREFPEPEDPFDVAEFPEPEDPFDGAEFPEPARIPPDEFPAEEGRAEGPGAKESPAGATVSPDASLNAELWGDIKPLPSKRRTRNSPGAPAEPAPVAAAPSEETSVAGAPSGATPNEAASAEESPEAVSPPETTSEAAAPTEESPEAVSPAEAAPDGAVAPTEAAESPAGAPLSSDGIPAAGAPPAVPNEGERRASETFPADSALGSDNAEPLAPVSPGGGIGASEEGPAPSDGLEPASGEAEAPAAADESLDSTLEEHSLF